MLHTYIPNMSETELAAYIHSLSHQERIVLKIANEHLESSFDLGTSLGFLKWQAEQPSGQAEQPSPAPKKKRRRLIRRKPTPATKLPSS